MFVNFIVDQKLFIYLQKNRTTFIMKIFILIKIIIIIIAIILIIIVVLIKFLMSITKTL